MSTAQVTSNTSAQTLFTVPEHQKAKITSINVDNQGSASRTIKIQDIFTPDESNGDSSPSEQTKLRQQLTVGAGLTASVSEEELKDVECLGVAKALGSAIDSSCVVVVSYHLE